MFNMYSSKEFESQYTYLGNDLGVTWAPEHTTFRLWAPTADTVSVHLFQSGTQGTNDRIRTVFMQPSSHGTWTVTVEGDLNGIYYTYVVSRNGETVEAIDPYARAAGVNGARAMVVDLSSTNPVGWEKDCNPNAGLKITDSVIYELHVRDLSSSSGSGIQAKGKYLGLTETGTKTRFGAPTGLDHIKALGVTHLHLLPIFDFGSVDEREQESRQFNWGYDPVNYNVPEGSYSSNPFDGAVRIRELKQTIQTLHRNGISVILDVVYNHVYHTNEFSINRIVPGYFSREHSNGSGCGNDTASERTMVRKYIVDSVNYWADEYHIDGFRFDLVGLLDTTTINEIMFTVRKKHPGVIFYGEGWDIPTHVTKPNISLAIQKNASILPGFAFFNDTIRDTMRGSVFDYHAPGYASGAKVEAQKLLDCFMGQTYWTKQPGQIINYVSCHDNHTLHDRIAEALPQADHAELARRCRLAAAFNLLSIGVPFFQAGEEMLRSKKVRPGVYVGNSYHSSDRINSIKWNQLADDEVSMTVEYYRGLIAIRKQYDVFRISNPVKAKESIHLLSDTENGITAFQLTDESSTLICAFNSENKATDITLPAGNWDVLAVSHRAGLLPLETVTEKMVIPPLCAAVLAKQDSNPVSNLADK